MPETVIDSAAGSPAGGPPPAVRPAADSRIARFEWPERVPWSVLGPEFARTWGRSGGKFEPEHGEITGLTGSGKTYLLATLLQERAAARGSAEILIATKKADKTIHQLGWPIVDDWRGVKKYRQVVFWPQTKARGKARKEFHRKKIDDLLSRLWVPDANTVIAFDEIGYVESLGGDIKDVIQMYWREARSQGITLLAMKQRPIGVVRDQHSETRWKFVFPPADRGDMDRFAELLGSPRDWAPVLDHLDQEAHEFVVRNAVSKDSFISWIDYELRPVQAQANQKGPNAREYLFGRPKVG